MTVPARAHLPASRAQKPANHLPSIRPGPSTPSPARPPPPSPSRVTMTVPARAHLSASPAPNPYNQLSFVSPGRSTPPPAPSRLPVSATRPVATGASQSYSVTTSCMAKDPVEKLIYEFNNLRLFMIDPDRSVLSRLLNQLCDPRSLCSLPVEDTLLVFETASEVHGRNIVPHIGQIVSTIIRIMSSVTGSLHVDGCSRVIRALSRYGIDPLGTEEEKSGIISSLCSPLSGCLMSTKESVSSGSALCVTALIQSNNWKFASHELVNNICLKVSGALEEVHCQTIAHLRLVIALSKQKQLRFGHWQSLVRSGLSILDESTKADNSELIISSIEMIQSIMKTLDLSIMSYEISSIAEAMEPLRGVCEPEVRNAASQLAQIATDLCNQISSSPCAVRNTRKRKRNEVEEITSAYHALFVCSSDKSDWVSLHDYAKDNRASLVDKLHTPRSTSRHVSETTSNDLKLITRKSYQLVENVHEAGLTLLGQFSSRNFVIDKYKNVKFTEATAKVVKMIAEEGVEMKEEDRHAFVYMMKREIFDNKPPPVDMSKWLSLVEGCDESISEIIKYHINLMDEHQSASAFTSMFDTLLDMEESDRGSYEAVMTELKEKPLYCDWQKFVNKKKGNGYLNETFRYSIDEKGLIYVNSPMGLLLMLRNSRHHSAKFKEAEFARIIAEHFPDLLSDLQLALHRQKKLSKLNLRYSMG